MDLIDLHCHLLPGIDDGPSDSDGSVALARAYVSAGISRIAATPHVNVRHQNDAATIREGRDTVTARLAEEGIALRVEQGAEIAASFADRLDEDELRRMTLGGGEWLLVEPPTRATGFEIHTDVFAVQKRGFRVLLAHPERNPALQEDPGMIRDLVASGVRTQVTAEALTGRYGSSAERCASWMFERGLVHVLASDAHHATERPPGMAGELRRSGHRELTNYLCREMPTWILDGGDEPPRPGNGQGTEASGGLLRKLGFRR
jgi:protein-tyrosine phosphatase